MIINVLPKSIEDTLNTNEKKIVHVAILNILALLNAIITQKGMVSNPIDDQPENLGYHVNFESTLSEEDEAEFRRRVTNQLSAFLTMSNVQYNIDIEK